MAGERPRPAHPAVSVREGGPADAATLAELGARTFRETYAAHNTPHDLQDHVAQAYGVRVQARELADAAHRYLLAELEGRPVGLAHLRSDVPPPDGVHGRRALMLHRLYVLADAHGVGAGAALLRAALDQAAAAGHDVLWLTVWERNPDAAAWYRRRGFAEVGETEFLLGGDRQRDLVMALPVQQRPQR